MDSSASTGPAGVSGSSSEQLRRLTKHLLGPGVPPAVQVKQKWKKYVTYEDGIFLTFSIDGVLANANRQLILCTDPCRPVVVKAR